MAAILPMMTGIAVFGPIAGMIGVVLALDPVVPLLLGASIASIFA